MQSIVLFMVQFFLCILHTLGFTNRNVVELLFCKKRIFNFTVLGWVPEDIDSMMYFGICSSTRKG